MYWLPLRFATVAFIVGKDLQRIKKANTEHIDISFTYYFIKFEIGFAQSIFAFG